MTEDAPDRETFERDPVTHAEIRAGMTVADLIEGYANTGFGGGQLAAAVELTATMFEDEVTCLMGLAGAMVPAGMRRLVTTLVREGHIDALVTTGATLTHDAIEAIGANHHHGAAHPDGVSRREHDEQLRAEQVDRIYDIYLPQEHFTAFEYHLREEVFPAFDSANGSQAVVPIADFVAELGRANAVVNERDDIRADPGIAAAATATDVPVYCPAIQDSVLGLQAWLRSQVAPFTLDALADTDGLTALAHGADETGAFVVGGGVPKNFVLQTMLVTPGAYEYAVQLTMDPPHTGGLSGATLDEARSWGKLDPDARNVSVYGDATITLPLVVAGALDRLEE